MEAFVFAVEAFDEAAAFAIDGGAEDLVAVAVGIPSARKIARGKDGDARGANGGGEVHGAGIVANVKAAVFQAGG